MLKGHTVIELTDAESGATQKIEHDNMVTNAIKYALTPWMGRYNYANITGKSIIDGLMGGILLFQNALREDIDNTSMPLDNFLTGKGSNDLYNGTDKSRGSYSAEESGIQEDGSYKKVWNFETNQANGQISAVALTTIQGGATAGGFTSDSSEMVRGDVYIGLNETSLGDGATNMFYPFIDTQSNYIYYINKADNLTYQTGSSNNHLSNSKKLLLRRSKFPLSSISPFYDYEKKYFKENIEITVPDEFAAEAQNKNCYGKTSDNYVYICVYGEKESGTSFKILKIKKSNWNTSVITLTNTTGKRINPASLLFTDDFAIFIYREYKSDGWYNTAYKINLQDNDVKSAEPLKGDGSNPFIMNGFILEPRGACYINTNTLECKKGYYFYENRTILSAEKLAPNVFLIFSSNGSSMYIKIAILAESLITINNLSSPVTKTAAQTMKITYTIQETEDIITP